MVLTISPGGSHSSDRRRNIRLLAGLLLVMTSLFSSASSQAIASAESATVSGQRVAVAATTVWYRPSPALGTGPNLLEAIDSTTGKVLRAFEVEAGALLAGASGNLCLLALSSGAVQAFSSTSSMPLWSYDAIEQPALLGSDDTAFYLGGTIGAAGEAQIVAVALEAGTGAERWRTILTRVGIGAETVRFRGFVSQGIAVAVPEGSHALYGIEATTGSIVWKERYDATATNLSVTAEGVLFFLDDAGSLETAVRACDLGSGEALWTLGLGEISEHASGMQGVYGAGDLVLVSYMTPTPMLEFNEGMRTGVAAIDASSGTVRWLFPGDDASLRGNIAFASDANGVYVHTTIRTAPGHPDVTYGLDQATGKER